MLIAPLCFACFEPAEAIQRAALYFVTLYFRQSLFNGYYMPLEAYAQVFRWNISKRSLIPVRLSWKSETKSLEHNINVIIEHRQKSLHLTEYYYYTFISNENLEWNTYSGLCVCVFVVKYTRGLMHNTVHMNEYDVCKMEVIQVMNEIHLKLYTTLLYLNVYPIQMFWDIY